MKRSPARSVDKAAQLCQRVMPNLLKKIEETDSLKKKTIVISFETLVTNPKETMDKVFKFCNLRSNKDIIKSVSSAKKDALRYFDGINSERAFSYMKTEQI